MSSNRLSRGPHKQTLSYYEANAKRFFENTRDIDMDVIYEPFLSLLPPGAHILDAGCGSGRDSSAFLRRGYEVTAFDASKTMGELASHHIGRPVRHMSFDQVHFAEDFDGIWACASLLHVPRHDMVAVLERLGGSLKEEAAMYTSFRYGRGEAVRDGRLFNDYDEGSFRGLLQSRPELEILKVWRTSDIRPNRDGVTWLNVLLRKCQVKGRQDSK